MKTISNDLMEKLAENEHNRWAGQALTALNEMTDERRERWGKLANTPYADLSEEMKELDRMQVREILDIMGVKYENNKQKEATKDSKLA